MHSEPVRTSMYVAAAFVALSTFFGGIGLVDEVTFQSVSIAVGAALGQFAVVAFGAELARSKAWAPATVEQIEETHAAEVRQVMDAEHVIAQAEAGEADPPTL